MDRLILLEAYVRRQRFLARLQAKEVRRVLFGEGKKQGPKEVTTAEMLNRVFS